MKVQMLAVVVSHFLLLPALAQTHVEVRATPQPQIKPLTWEQTIEVVTQQGLTEVQPLGGNNAMARDRTGQQVRVLVDPRTRSVIRTDAVR